MMERILWNGGMVVVGGLLVACATQEGVLRERVSAELECPPAGVEIAEAGPDTFDVSACGEQAIYVCTSADDPGGIVCTREESAVATAGGESQVDGEDAEAGYGVNDSLGEPDDTADAEASDSSDTLDGEDAPRDEGVAPGADEGTSGEPAREQNAQPAEGESEGAGQAAAPAGPAAVESAVRRAIDERNDVILECVGRDHVVVSAAYRRTGAVSVSLRGDLEGTAEERCVATALRGLRVNTRRTEGVVLHPVHH